MNTNSNCEGREDNDGRKKAQKTQKRALPFCAFCAFLRPLISLSPFPSRLFALFAVQLQIS